MSRIKQSLVKHIGDAANLMVAEYGIVAFPRAEKEERELLLTVSKWSRFRKPEKYLEILRCLSEDITLVFAGRWDSEKDLLDFSGSVQAMNLYHRVRILKDLSEDELSRLYDRTRVFLRLGFNETGTGQAIFEAIGHGCPVIVSKELGAADIVLDGVNGFIVDENNIPDVASKILEIFRNDELFGYMSQESYKLAESMRWETYLKRIMSTLL